MVGELCNLTTSRFVAGLERLKPQAADKVQDERLEPLCSGVVDLTQENTYDLRS